MLIIVYNCNTCLNFIKNRDPLKPHKNILILCSASFSLSNFRGDLIIFLRENNYKVFCAAPDFNKNTKDLVEKLGGIPINYELQRTGLNPFKDLNTIRSLKDILKENKIDVLFPYTIKPVIYGSFAAKKLKIPVVSLITGLGFTFSRVTLRAKILQHVTEYLYRRALRSNKVVVFQNIDDKQLFIKRKIVSITQKVSVVNGSGVNLSKYNFRSISKDNSSEIKFVLVARLLKEKGVQLFMNAARDLKPKYPGAQFHIVGSPPENNSSAISINELKELNDSNIIVYHGKSDNVGQLITGMDVFVLPTWYREGVPRSILEALSIGMPIVTTHQPGCKETVIENENGFLIPPQEEQSLINAMKFFLHNPDKISIMGSNSRKLAEKKFDVDIINKQLLNLINENLSSP